MFKEKSTSKTEIFYQILLKAGVVALQTPKLPLIHFVFRRKRLAYKCQDTFIFVDYPNSHNIQQIEL